MRVATFEKDFLYLVVVVVGAVGWGGEVIIPLLIPQHVCNKSWLIFRLGKASSASNIPE